MAGKPRHLLHFNQQFNRGMRAPLDTTSLFESLEKFKAYLKRKHSNVYDGMMTTVHNDDAIVPYNPYIVSSSTPNDVKMLSDKEGEWGYYPVVKVIGTHTASLPADTNMDEYYSEQLNDKGYTPTVMNIVFEAGGQHQLNGDPNTLYLVLKGKDTTGTD